MCPSLRSARDLFRNAYVAWPARRILWSRLLQHLWGDVGGAFPVTLARYGARILLQRRSWNQRPCPGHNRISRRPEWDRDRPGLYFGPIRFRRRNNLFATRNQGEDFDLNRFAIDLNADMGESPGQLADGTDAELMRCITSANVACGAHAGDLLTMEQTVELARQNKVAIGAHPSYPDRAGFGRRVISLTTDELQASIVEQLNMLRGVANRLNARVTHVKPHGALYHSCNNGGEIARAVARAVLAVDANMLLVGQAGFPCLNVYRQMGLRIASEAFADRKYEADGTLRGRSLPGA